MSWLPKTLPYIKEGIAVSSIMFSGDILCQTLVDEKNIREIDLNRSLKFSAIGLFFIGPVLHFWVRKLDQLILPNQTALKRGLKKMAVDQSCAAPTFLFTVICLDSAFNGKSIEQTNTKLKNDYFEILKTNYMVWPFVMAINFTLVPISYQVVFAQTIAILWNCYLSYALKK